MARDGWEMFVWWGTEIECASALARLARDDRLGEREEEAALQRLDALAAIWYRVHAGEPVRRIARRLLRTHPLRAADALQLAAAIAASEGQPESLPVVSLDDRLSVAARREGFAVLTPGVD